MSEWEGATALHRRANPGTRGWPWRSIPSAARAHARGLGEPVGVTWEGLTPKREQDVALRIFARLVGFDLGFLGRGF